MPYYKCGKCHHEWEASEPRPCDWCGYPNSIQLEGQTPLEKLCGQLTRDLDTAYGLLIHQAGDNRNVAAKFIKTAKSKIGRIIEDAQSKDAESK